VSDCIFCKIVAKELPAEVIYEDQTVLVFKDINPVAPTHLLVIPKQHIANINDPELLNNNSATHLFVAIQKVTKDLGLADSGFRVVINRGLDAGEAVPHLHFHVLANRKLNWPPG
jgi:histidine triad (HIT) family protein